MALNPKFKRLNNARESQLEGELSIAVGNFEGRVLPKIGLKDVLVIEGSGLNDEMYHYALMAHFDFVVYDAEEMPCFVVEYDGPQHATNEQQRERDRKKDALCDAFGLPILRIDRKFLEDRFGRFSLVRWLAEVWFLKRQFDQEQAAGEIPLDEGFHPLFFYRSGDSPLRPSHYPFIVSHNLLRDALWSGAIKSYDYGVHVAKDASGYVNTYAFVEMHDATTLIARARLKSFAFEPFSAEELVTELASVAGADILKAYQRGEQVAATPQQVATARAEWKSWPITFAGYADGVGYIKAP
jgi:Protein of unknown function (DUF2726)